MQPSVCRPVGHSFETAEKQRKSDRSPSAQGRTQSRVAKSHPETNVSGACLRWGLIEQY